MDNKILGSQAAANGVKVEVELDNETCSRVGKMLAMTVMQSHPTVGQLMKVSDVAQCFTYALSIVVSVDSGARPKFDPVPTFFTDLFIPISLNYRGVRVTVSELDTVERPAFYDDFVDIMSSVGVCMGRPGRVDLFQDSRILQIGMKNVDETKFLCGIESSITIEELIVRSMIAVSDEENEKLSRVIGHMEYLYVSRDEIIRNWACSLPAGKTTVAR